MLEFEINSDDLSKSIKALQAMTHEARFKFTQGGGLSVKSVDQANVAMVSLELRPEAFKSYTASDTTELGIDIPKLSGILEMAQKDTNTHITLDEQKHKLKIIMGGIQYEMALLDPVGIRKDPKVPALDMPAHIRIKGDDMKYAIKATGKVGDYISFMATQTSFTMTTDGETDQCKFEAYLKGEAPNGMQTAELLGMEFKGPNKVVSLYSIDYLKDIQAHMGNKDVTIQMGTDFPVKISWPIINGMGNIMYMIAPRVESD